MVNKKLFPRWRNHKPRLSILVLLSWKGNLFFQRDALVILSLGVKSDVWDPPSMNFLCWIYLCCPSLFLWVFSLYVGLFLLSVSFESFYLQNFSVLPPGSPLPAPLSFKIFHRSVSSNFHGRGCCPCNFVVLVQLTNQICYYFSVPSKRLENLTNVTLLFFFSWKCCPWNNFSSIVQFLLLV